MDKQRVLAFLLRSRTLSSEGTAQLREILRDIQSLLTHSSFLFEKEDFLMDAARGFINIEPRFSISTLLRPHNALNLREKRRKSVCHRRVTTPPTVFHLFSPIFSTLHALATRLMENPG